MGVEKIKTQILLANRIIGNHVFRKLKKNYDPEQLKNFIELKLIFCFKRSRIISKIITAKGKQDDFP